MVLFGGTLYGTMSSFVKLAYSYGFNAAELSFWQAFLAAGFLFICALASRKTDKGKLKRKDLLPLILTGSSIGLTNFLYYESVQYIPASLAIIILMQFTWMSILLERIIFTRKTSKMELLTILFILVGTVLAGGVLEIKEWVFSFRGILFALCSSFTYAVYIVANARIGKGVRWQSKSMIIMVGSSVCIFTINSGVIIAGNYLCPEFVWWAFFLAVAGTTIPTALSAAAISKIGSGISSILMTVELPIAIICARIVLKEQVSALQVAGIIIMLVSISAMNYYKVIKTKK